VKRHTSSPFTAFYSGSMHQSGPLPDHPPPSPVVKALVIRQTGNYQGQHQPVTYCSRRGPVPSTGRPIYGLKDFDTATSQLGATGAQPYGDLVWSGQSPWTPQPPSTVSRIIGPNRVWTAQSLEPTSNWNMNNTGWVPSSYQNFVQYSVPAFPPCNSGCESTDYPVRLRRQRGLRLGDRDQLRLLEERGDPARVDAVSEHALRTAAILDKFPADANGVYGSPPTPTTARRPASSPTFPPRSRWTCTSTAQPTV
jgi:hypothetical protein